MSHTNMASGVFSDVEVDVERFRCLIVGQWKQGLLNES